MKIAALLSLAMLVAAPMGLAHAQLAEHQPWTAAASLYLERADDGTTSLQQLLEHNPGEVPDLDGRTFTL